MQKLMKVLKVMYEIIIWILLLIYIISRKDTYFTNDITMLDNIILILFGIFLLLPIFSEVDFMGVKLKKEIEKNKIEIDKELLQLRTEINNNMIHNSNVINNYTNLPDNALKNIEIEYQNAKKQDIDIEIDNDSILCLKIRQRIEVLTKQIAQKCDILENNHGLVPLLRLLTNKEIISKKLYSVLFEIIIICNKSIHGEEISNNHREFIKNTYEKVLLELEEVSINRG